jgi:uncharacterized protein (DUF983 family)
MGRIAFVIASALDVLTTHIGISAGVAREGNPLMVAVADSVPAMIVMKTLGFFALWGITLLLPISWRKPAWWVLAGVTFGVVINNLIVIGV